jgi:hypothetical protein
MAPERCLGARTGLRLPLAFIYEHNFGIFLIYKKIKAASNNIRHKVSNFLLLLSALSGIGLMLFYKFPFSPPFSTRKSF